jgi:hypothetical protein
MKRFNLGVHEPGWLGRLDFPLCVARQRLWRGNRNVPRALAPWILDSGAYMQLYQYGHWTISPKEYVRFIRRCMAEIGNLDWAAPMDHMCEAHIRAKTGLDTPKHQILTVDNLIELRTLDATLPVITVLQGDPEDPPSYLRCAELYEQRGVELAGERVVGVGGLCRLQDTRLAAEILRLLGPLYLPLHGFGFKTRGLTDHHRVLWSADSMAWSYNARKNAPLPGCTHQRCNNCIHRATWWRDRLLTQIGADHDD